MLYVWHLFLVIDTCLLQISWLPLQSFTPHFIKILFFKDFVVSLLLYLVPGSVEGSSNLSLSTNLSVCYAFLWRLDQYVFLILHEGVKLGFNKHYKWGFLIFSKYVPWIFLKLYLMADIKKWVEVTVLYFKRKFLLCPKLGKWVIFGPKINSFELFSRSAHWIFLKLYVMMYIKK